MFYLYKITNTVNGKVYIGRTNNADVRWKSHQRAARGSCQFLLARAIRKYGIAAFCFAVVSTYETIEDVVYAEIEAIQSHKSYDDAYGYNMTLGGEGYEHMTPERRKTAAAKTLATLGVKGIAARAAKIRAANAIRTPEQIAESARKRHETMGPEGRAARSATRVSRTTREQRLASAAKAKATITPEMRREMARKAFISKGGHEGCRATAAKINEALGPAGRSNRVVKSWETRHRNRYNATVDALLGAY